MTRIKATWRSMLAKAGEEAAYNYYQSQGAQVISKNWRVGRFAEIDLIIRESTGTLVFAEVKSRSKKLGDLDFVTSGFDAVHARKQHKIITSAKIYLAQHKLTGIPCRLDVVIVEFVHNDKDKLRPSFSKPAILHVPDAFHL